MALYALQSDSRHSYYNTCYSIHTFHTDVAHPITKQQHALCHMHRIDVRPVPRANQPRGHFPGVPAVAMAKVQWPKINAGLMA